MNPHRMIAAGLLILFLAACGAPPNSGIPATSETATPGSPTPSPGLPPEAVLQAQEWLAALLGVATAQAQVVDLEQAEWSDSCLGLGGPTESCLQVTVPGWRVVFEVDGRRYEVRTDETGSTVRLASPAGTPGGGISLENTSWNLVSLGEPEANTPLVENSNVTLLLAGGQAEGMGGCNSYSGTYQVQGNSITFDQIIRTERACAEARITEQEQRYFEGLESAERYTLDNNQLRIWYAEGTGLMVFEPALPAGPGAAPQGETATPGG